MVDTNEWPVDAKVSLYDEHGTYLVVEYDNWKYLVETKGLHRVRDCLCAATSGY